MLRALIGGWKLAGVAFLAGALAGGWGVWKLWAIDDSREEVAALEAQIDALREVNATTVRLAAQAAEEAMAARARIADMESEERDVVEELRARGADDRCMLDDRDLERLRNIGALRPGLSGPSPAR